MEAVMGARERRDQGQRRARSIRLALAGGGVVATVVVAGVVQATSGVASTSTGQAPSVDVPDQSGFGQLPDGSDPGSVGGFLAPGGQAGGGFAHGSSHGS
jgi:hypothetical protein